MRKQKIKVKRNLKDLVKETPEQRLERIHSQATYTRVVESKKTKYNRQRFKRGQDY